MMGILTNKWFQAVILLSTLVVLTFMSFSNARWRQQIRNLTFDYYNILKPYQSHDDVVIVDIDEASLAHEDLGQWPWPRTKLADLVSQLKKYGARVITFDMVFSEPDRSSPHYILDALHGDDKAVAQNQAVQDALMSLPDNDQVFGDEIKAAGNVVTGFSLTNESTSSTPRLKAGIVGKHIERYVPQLAGVASNIPKIGRNAAGNGSFFVSSDTDGVIRRVPMLVAHQKHGGKIVSIYPALPLESVRVLWGEKRFAVELDDKNLAKLDPGRFGIQGIKIGNRKKLIPTNPKGEFLVYFAKPHKEWYVSALSVMNGTVDPSRIKNKVVLIGTSAVGLKDIRSTPLDPFRPGVEIHLNIIDQILHRTFLHRPIGAEGGEAFSIFAVGGAVMALSLFTGALAQLVFVVGLISAAFAAGWYAFAEYGLLIDVLYPSIAISIIFVISAVFAYLRTEVERRRVRQAFGLYISPDFMEELTRHPEKLKLGGETRDLTVMFTDIRNFTSISERLSPEALIQLMNEFLTPMSNLVMDNRGTIDKYMGDAMMAFWNAPLDDKDHALHACQAAMRMNKSLKPINAKLKAMAEAERRPPILLKAGIGINTGPASVGNMGSKQRFAYSALGDAVNLASRLEGQTKNYGCSVLIGPETQAQVPQFATLEVDLIRVKGKKDAVRIYGLIGNDQYKKQRFYGPWAEAHARMLALYRSGQFDAAMKLCRECVELSEGRMRFFYELYMQRAQMLKDNPPPADWGGVYEALTK